MITRIIANAVLLVVLAGGAFILGRCTTPEPVKSEVVRSIQQEIAHTDSVRQILKTHVSSSRARYVALRDSVLGTPQREPVRRAFEAADTALAADSVALAECENAVWQRDRLIKALLSAPPERKWRFATDAFVDVEDGYGARVTVMRRLPLRHTWAFVEAERVSGVIGGRAGVRIEF